MREKGSKQKGRADLELHGRIQIDTASQAVQMAYSGRMLATVLEIFTGDDHHASHGWRARRARDVIVRSLKTIIEDQSAPEDVRAASAALSDIMTGKTE